MLKEFLKNYQSEQEAKKKMLQNKQDELHIRIRETTQFILYLEKDFLKLNLVKLILIYLRMIVMVMMNKKSYFLLMNICLSDIIDLLRGKMRCIML